MKCIILAAGYATRMYPLTENFPKPLLEVGGKAILDWLVDDLASCTEEFVVVTNHKYAEHFRKWSQRKPVVVVDDGTSTNETRLGAVKDIQFAIYTLHLTGDLLILAGDNVLDFSLFYYSTTQKAALAAFFALIGLFLGLSGASAELSTNLQIRTELNPYNKKVSVATYVDAAGNPVIPDDKGYASIHYVYGTDSLVVETSFTDAEGRVCNCIDGYSKVKYAYSVRNLARTEYFDVKGNPVNGPEGFAKKETKYWYKKHQSTYEYDAEGNIVNLHRISEFNKKDYPGLMTADAWYDAEGNPAIGPEGYARVEYEYRRAVLRKITYLDENGELIYNEKAKFAVKEFVYENARLHELIYCGADGELCAGPDGYARAVYSYINNDGNHTRIMYYNADGSLFFTKDGICGIQQNKTVRGDVTDESYFIGEDQRGYISKGYSRWTRKLNRKRKIGFEVFYDDEDRRIVPIGVGYCEKQNTYTSDSQILSRTEYFDENGKPMIGPEGYFAASYKIEHNLNVQTTFLDTDGETPINGKNGYARINYEYNEKGKVIKENYYDMYNHSFVIRDNADELRYDWDGDGKNKISESYWAANQPVVSDKGYHEIRYEYTGDNKIAVQTYFDIEGNPVATSDGYARIENQYSTDGKLMATLYFDLSGELMLAPGKEYAYVRTIPAGDKAFLGEADEDPTSSDSDSDSEGFSDLASDGSVSDISGDASEGSDALATLNGDVLTGVVYVEYYDADNRRMNLSSGYATSVRTLNEGGQITEEAYFDANGEKTIISGGYHSYRQEIGPDGVVLSIAYYGLDGEPVINTKAKYHKTVRTWWDKSHISSETFFDTEEKLITPGDTYVRIEREFDRRGNTIHEQYIGADGEKVKRNAGYDEIWQTFDNSNHIIQIEYGLGGTLVRLAAGYAIIGREYDYQGRLSRESYYDEFGQKTLLPDGYHSYVNVYGDDGLVASLGYFGIEDEPIINTKVKYHRLDRVWLDSKHVLSESYFGVDGEAVVSTDTFARVEMEYDARGNTISERYYGANGEAIAREAGYDEQRHTYNSMNQAIRTEYLLNGEPVLCVDGYAVIEREYDIAGNVIAQSYYGTAGEPVINTKAKYHRVESAYRDPKHVTSEAYYDTEGNPMTRGDTYVKIMRDFDERGNIISERYYGADGWNINRNAGYDEVRQEFDELNRITRIAYYQSGIPIMLPGGYSIILREYNDKGQMIRESYLDTDGEKVLLPDGYQSFTQDFGDDGLVASLAYFGLEEESVLNTRAKYHRLDRTWMDAKHVTSEAYFGVDGEPITIGNTCVRIEREFDERGNTVREVYFGANGAPIALNAGYDEIRQEFDAGNRVTRIEYYLGGDLVMLGGGYAVILREYNEAGLMTRESYLGTDGAACLLPDGYQAFTQTYGNDKLVASLAYFGIDGEPVINTKAKYHRIDRTWKDAKHATSEAWFGVEGEAIPLGDTFVRVEREFDERGNTIRECYFGADGTPIARKAGYDEIRQAFGEKAWPARIEYYISGEPFVFAEGYSAVERDYDSAGNVIWEKYFDAEGAACACSRGYGEIRREFNGKNQVVFEAWFDTDGVPIQMDGDAYFGVRKEYDENGRVNVLKYLDADGMPTTCTGGYQMVWRRFDDSGRVNYETYMDHEGTLMPNVYGVYQVSYDYDEEGRKIRETYFDADGNAMENDEGYVAKEWYYGENETIIETGIPLTKSKLTENGFNLLPDCKNAVARCVQEEGLLWDKLVYGKILPVSRGFASSFRQYMGIAVDISWRHGVSGIWKRQD